MSKRTPEEEADLISKFWGRVKISGTDGPCIANGTGYSAKEARVLQEFFQQFPPPTERSAENRMRLLVVRADGRRLLDLLALGLFEDVMEAMDLQTDLPVRAASRGPAPLPRDRRPPSPVDLFDAEQGPAHVERGRHPKARLGRLRRGK